MRTMVVLLVCTICTPGLVWGTFEQAKDSVVIPDPEGDVLDSGDNPGKDVVNVTMRSDGEQSHVDVTLKQEASYYLDGHHAGDVVLLNIDADGDATTGGELAFGKKTGFEYEVGVRAYIKYEAGEACAGALTGAKATGFFSTFTIGQFGQGEPFADSTHEVFWKIAPSRHCRAPGAGLDPLC